MNLPQPYYADSHCTIYHGDCREILPHLSPVDLVLTDPPYINMKGGLSYKGKGVANTFTESIALSDPWNANLDWIDLVYSSIEYGVMVFCSYHFIADLCMKLREKFKMHCLITWHKNNAPPQGKNVPNFSEEYIWCFSKKPGLKWDAFQRTLIIMPFPTAGCMSSERICKNGKAIHPTQKPLSLIKNLLSVGGQTILDPFMGSGTTLRAAKDLGRKAIGIEIEEKYCEIAVNRLRQESFGF